MENDPTFEAIKKALSGGRELDGVADRELIERLLALKSDDPAAVNGHYMGPPKPKARTGTRGPTPTGNQYTEALERRRDPYRRIVRLPLMGRDSGYLRNPEYLELVIRVLIDQSIKLRERRGRLSDAIMDARLRQPEPRTLTRMLNIVERHLKKLSEMRVP